MQTITYGNWAVEEALVLKVQELLPFGSTIIELGSGDGSTPALAKNYNVISIEENEQWLNKYEGVKYIHAPLKPHKEVQNYSEYKQIYYDANVLRAELPKIYYDLILVDGPSSQGSRVGFIKYFDLFKQDVPILFDDLQRVREWKVVHGIASKLLRPYTIFPCRSGKPFALIP